MIDSIAIVDMSILTKLLGQTDKREVRSEVSMHLKSTTELIEAAANGFKSKDSEGRGWEEF